MTPKSGKPSTIWSPTHRAVVLLLLTGLAVLAAVRLLSHPTQLPDELPASAPRAHELADRLDPNVASWEELAALPNIGEKRARDIIDYRDAQLQRSPDRLPFNKPQDLQNVRGIGPAITNQLMPYLVFPNPTPPATSPTSAPTSRV